jgi:hypothetical protein
MERVKSGIQLNPSFLSSEPVKAMPINKNAKNRLCFTLIKNSGGEPQVVRNQFIAMPVRI